MRVNEGTRLRVFVTTLSLLILGACYLSWPEAKTARADSAWLTDYRAALKLSEQSGQPILLEFR